MYAICNAWWWITGIFPSLRFIFELILLQIHNNRYLCTNYFPLMKTLHSQHKHLWVSFFFLPAFSGLSDGRDTALISNDRKFVSLLSATAIALSVYPGGDEVKIQNSFIPQPFLCCSLLSNQPPSTAPLVYQILTVLWASGAFYCHITLNFMVGIFRPAW